MSDPKQEAEIEQEERSKDDLDGAAGNGGE